MNVRKLLVALSGALLICIALVVFAPANRPSSSSEAHQAEGPTTGTSTVGSNELVRRPKCPPDTDCGDGVSMASQDGVWIASTEYRNGLVLFRSETNGDVTTFIVGVKGVGDLAFSSDSRLLAYSQMQAQGLGDTDLFVLNLPPNAPVRRLTATDGIEEGWPVFSPDGSRLAFVSNRAGLMSVFVIDLFSRNANVVQVSNVGLDLDRAESWDNDLSYSPPPDGPVKWASKNHLTWTSRGKTYTMEARK